MSMFIGARSRAHASRLAAAGLTVFLALGTSGAVYAAAGGAVADGTGSSSAGQAGGGQGNPGGVPLVPLCHVVGGTSRTIEVPVEAVGSVPGVGDHLAQHPGDHLGECGPDDPPPADDGGTTTPPGDGGTTTPPGDGGTTTPPGDGGTTTPPGDGGTTAPPAGGDEQSGGHKPRSHKPPKDDAEILGTSGHKPAAKKQHKRAVVLGKEASRKVNRPKVKVLPQTGTAETLGLESAAGLMMLIAGGALLGRRRESDL